MRLWRPFPALVLAALALTGTSVPLLPDTITDTRIAVIEERIEELEVSDEVRRSEIEELAQTRNITTALRNTRAEIHQDGVLIRDLEPAIEAYRVSIAELEEMHRQMDGSDPITPLDLTKKAAENRAKAAMKAAMEAGGMRVASKTLGIASWVGAFVEYVGKGIITDLNEDRMGEQVLFEMQKLVQALDRLVELENHRAEMIRTLHRLRDLQRQSRADFAELASLRQELARLRGLAGGGKSPCKTASVATEKSAPAADKTAPKPEEASSIACDDLAGVWTLQTNTTLFGRTAEQPMMQAEFVALDASGDGNAPGYAVFALGKERAADPFLRCAAPVGEATLACERRVQPQDCPVELYAWEPITLTLSEDQSRLDGGFTQTMTMDVLADPTGCTVVAFDGGGQIDLAFRRAAAD